MEPAPYAERLEQLRRLGRAPQAILAVGAGFALVFVYPLVIDAAAARFGVRGVATALLVVLGWWRLRARRSAGGEAVGLGRGLQLAVAGLLLAAAGTGHASPLRGVLAVLYAGLAWTFGRSLRGEGSLIQRLVQTLEPAAPDFIAGYCRVVTALWTGFFAVAALWLAGLAALGGPAAWHAWGGRALWIAMLAFFGIEFLVRKTRFRYYYYGGPFDRFWSALFPAENTEMGRRSAAYIRHVKARGDG